MTRRSPVPRLHITTGNQRVIIAQGILMLSPMCFYHPRWPVFFEDNHLLALFKPAGLLAQGDRSGAVCLLELAKDWLRKRHAKPGRVFLGLVHRLDRPVAGVMLFARTSKAAARLSAQFRCGTIQKTYLAVVEGTPAQPNGNLYDHIERQGLSCRILSEPSGNSREARLQYRLIDSTGDRSLLQVAPQTGRRHQIRLQLSHAGNAIVGDVRYGAVSPLKDRQLALLAKEITVMHPTLKTPLRLTCPLPAGWPWPAAPEKVAAPFWNYDDFLRNGGRFPPPV
ncbi:MAG: RNA pseudouridine synthase [Desulfobacterales bacterium]